MAFFLLHPIDLGKTSFGYANEVWFADLFHRAPHAEISPSRRFYLPSQPWGIRQTRDLGHYIWLLAEQLLAVEHVMMVGTDVTLCDLNN